MKAFKRIISSILTLAMLISVFPLSAFAEGESENIYSISNGYLTYSFNADTGGFAIETEEGNPRKLLDNDIPLLYSDDKERSNGTSFITVRIGKKDYIFGQEYGFFGKNSKLETPTVSEEGRLMTIPYTVEGVTVTLKVALSTDENTDITGNAGISFEVTNNSGKDEEVSVRLLLDTALGNDIDAPYFVVDEAIRPTMTETEFSGDEMPSQIRCVDSLSEPTKLAYIMTKGWNGGVEASKVIVGHWANLANTRYTYTPDNYCDFTNYSNDYRTPDSAAAIYWENKSLANGASYTGEMLYGVGNFSNSKDDITQINITAGRVELSDDGKSYKNDGKFDVTVEIDNTIDGAKTLTSAMLNVTLDDTQLEIVDGNSIVTFDEIGKEIITETYTFRALPQTDLTAGTIYVALTATADFDGTEQTVETAAQKNVIIQSVMGNKPVVQLNKVNPEIVWTGGEKAVTISGSMSAFEALSANQGWDLRLYHTTSDDVVLIEKKNIAFLDDAYENMSFTTDEELEVGEYKIVFEFTDKTLVSEFGKSITCNHTLQVSADEKYRQKSYGTIAIVRITGGDTTYDIFTFRNEGEYLQFYYGEIEKTGEINNKKVKFNFGGDEEGIAEYEILLTVRANLREMERGEGSNKEKYWQAEYGDGDIIINNMLSYEGDNPLEISASKGTYTIVGDGLLKVVNSINVWRSKWSFTVRDGLVYTLDTERLSESLARGGNELQLSLDGAATMIQQIGGFLIDLKYGVMSSQWYDDSDGMVTYGIGFGGSMSLPIKAKEEEKMQDLTADQEDMSDAFTNLFGEDEFSYSSGSTDNTTSTAQKTSEEDSKLTKDTNLSEGSLAIDINNVLFGEKGDVNEETQKVEVDDTGFIGIDATATLALPKDVLGSLVSNAPGIYASVTINTIENVYELEAGLNIKVIECEGVLAFKEVNVKNKDVIVPDKIEFYIREGLKIPLAPPVLFMTGLGGGINELADTIGGEFTTLPPITILLFTRLEAIGTLIGDFNAKVSLEGLSLTGDMTLKVAKGVLDLSAGINARWIEPWELNLYGNISIIDGLIQGGISVNIADDYFYGYIYASICVPDSIPFVGGKELAGVEAAVSDEFIGANIKIIGIRFGVIYYWGENVSFGKNIDLSAPAKDEEDISLMTAEDVTGYYGTNVHELSVQTLGLTATTSTYKEASVVVENANGQDALLIEIPYTGSGEPQAGEITLRHKIGDTEYEFTTEADDGEGGGNMLLQKRDGDKYIYVTITSDKYKAVTGKSNLESANGTWKVRYTTENITIDSFSMNGVDDIVGIDTCIVTHTSDTSLDITTSWTVTGSTDKKGTIDVYLTEDKDILKKIKTEDNSGDTLGVNVLHKTNADIKNGSEVITLPDTFESGTYYVVTTISTTDGISLAISNNAVTIKNPNLPKAVKSVKISYGGNGNLFVKVEDADNADDYTHYVAEIVDADGTKTLSNNITQIEKGKTFVFGKEAYLEAGKNYKVNIKTLREEYVFDDETNENKKVYYYGDDTVPSNTFNMPEKNMPNLLDLKTNFDTSKEYINQNDIIVEYVFDKDVYTELSINGLKAYSDNKAKKEWKFVLDDLEDGDYVIDFTAYTDSKDNISGADATIGDSDARLAFTIDTSAPVLSLSQVAQESIDSETSNAVAVFGTNTVITDDNGNYTIEGLTEKSASLTIDGVSDGITLGENGSFTITKTLPADSAYTEHTLKAVDKAGNESVLMVYTVRKGSLAISSINLKNNGDEISLVDGEKKISIRNGQSTLLTAWAKLDNGKEFKLDDEVIDWTLLYEKNRVMFNNGEVTALQTGETAVKVKMNTGEIQTEEDTTVNDGFADYTVIEVLNNSRADLVDKIKEAQTLLDSTPDATESKKTALQNAINSATEVVNSGSATESDYTNAVTSLNNAMAEFKRTKSGGGGGGGSSATYKVTLLPTENGTATLSASQVKSGTSVTITSTPDDGYMVKDILVNGVSVGSNDEVYTIKSITKNTEIQVIFCEKTDLPFVDVQKTDWFYDNVKYAYKNGLMVGMTDITFEPETKLSRAMFVTILHRIDGEDDGAECIFDDVPGDAYYRNAVAWANANGIVVGVSDTEFAPESDITREQMTAILYRYAKYKGVTTYEDESRSLTSYDDYDEISDYAITSMQWAFANELIYGKSDTTLNPQDNATRAEAAAVFMRFIENID